MENLPKNGSFVERKKVFVDFPFHSLNHHSPFQWPEDRSSSEQLRVKNRPNYEHEYIRRVYNQRLEQQLNAKYNAPLDSFRAIPNQITYRRDQQVLAKEIEHFNQVKQTPINNPEHQDLINQYSPSLHRNYQSAKQINSKPQVDHMYHLPHLNHNKNVIFDASQQNNLSRSRMSHVEKLGQSQKSREEYHNIPSPKYGKEIAKDNHEERPDQYKRPYIRKSYGPQSLQNYQSYSSLINESNLQPPIHPLRNYLPDQLQGHLRQNLRGERRRPTNNNILSLQTRLKQ